MPPAEMGQPCQTMILRSSRDKDNYITDKQKGLGIFPSPFLFPVSFV